MGRKPEWIKNFLGKVFFHPCNNHQNRQNETNRYCIDCDSSVCQYCVASGTHRNHKLLKIYRHVCKDVVSLAAVDKYINCSQIQAYKCNKRLVIALNPLPHCGPISSNEASCEICNRRLAEQEISRFCSISCKENTEYRTQKNLEDDLMKNKYLMCFLSLQQVKAFEEHPEEDLWGPSSPICSPAVEKVAKAKLPGRPTHRRRKGVPCRAPFY